ncbi:MAG TPA: hypothetical protein VLT33_12285, partial [Labilithrix sp.]|nr:hypothetical protein [Labilithrix sp.]
MQHRSLRGLPLALLLAGCAQGGLAAPQDALPEPSAQDALPEPSAQHDTAGCVRPMAIAEPRAAAAGSAAIGD